MIRQEDLDCLQKVKGNVRQAAVEVIYKHIDLLFLGFIINQIPEDPSELLGRFDHPTGGLALFFLEDLSEIPRLVYFEEAAQSSNEW